MNYGIFTHKKVFCKAIKRKYKIIYILNMYNNIVDLNVGDFVVGHTLRHNAHRHRRLQRGDHLYFCNTRDVPNICLNALG